MNFDETFKSWTLEQKVEWALGPYICNLSENMRSIIVDLKAENERLKRELKQTEAQDQVVIDGQRKENAKLKCLALHLFKHLAYHECDDWNYIGDGLAESKLKKRCVRNADRWWRIAKRCNEAYRKARESLRAGK